MPWWRISFFRLVHNRVISCMSNDTNSKNIPGDPSRISSFLDYLVHTNDKMRNENAENLRLFAQQLVFKILPFENWQVRQILRWGKRDYIDFCGAVTFLALLHFRTPLFLLMILVQNFILIKNHRNMGLKINRNEVIHH